MKKILFSLVLLAAVGYGAFWYPTHKPKLSDFVTVTEETEKPPTETELNDILVKKAEASDPVAQFQLSVNYRLGQYGFPVDVAKEMEWLKKAAANGSAFAQSDLGGDYVMGINVPIDIPEGVRLLRLAANKNDVFALNTLCDLFSAPHSPVVNDPQQAAIWCPRAAKFGPQPRGAQYVGRFYEEGRIQVVIPPPAAPAKP